MSKRIILTPTDAQLAANPAINRWLAECAKALNDRLYNRGVPISGLEPGKTIEIKIGEIDV